MLGRSELLSRPGETTPAACCGGPLGHPSLTHSRPAAPPSRPLHHHGRCSRMHWHAVYWRSWLDTGPERLHLVLGRAGKWSHVVGSSVVGAPPLPVVMKMQHMMSARALIRKPLMDVCSWRTHTDAYVCVYVIANVMAACVQIKTPFLCSLFRSVINQITRQTFIGERRDCASPPLNSENQSFSFFSSL